MRQVLKGILGLVMIVYPFLVYGAIQYNTPVILACLLLSVAGLRLFIFTGSAASQFTVLKQSAVLIIGLALLSLWMRSSEAFMIYPILMNFILLIFFAKSLLEDKTVIQRFAEIKEQNITSKKQRYMRRLTVIWCVFFLINGLLSFYTWQYTSLEIWTLYNGLISYILIGLLVTVELIYRRIFIMKPSE